MSGHTPGPFEPMKHAEQGDAHRCAVVAVRGKYRYLVATIENGAPGDTCDTEYANAMLFSAADALLDALLSAPIPGRGEEMMAFRDRQDKWLREISRPAIAKATSTQAGGELGS